MSKYFWIIDLGHGGLDEDGVYKTSGKRAYFKDGELMDDKSLGVDYCEKNCDFKYYEGVEMRKIGAMLEKKLKANGIRFEFTVDPHDPDDIPLKARSKFINDINLPDSEKKVVSIHSNGVGYAQRSANGFQCHVYKNPKTGNSSSGSLRLAEISIEEFSKVFPNIRLRHENGLKRNNLHMTREPNCNAILLENLFHTNFKECSEILATKEGKMKIVSYITNAILRYEKES
jgi:N-acetylmuramoyl-L-alanine amidase